MIWSSGRPGVIRPDAASTARWTLDDLEVAPPLPDPSRLPTPVPPAPAVATPDAAAADAAAHDLPLAEAYAQGFEEGRLEGEAAEQARLRTAVRAAAEALDALRAGEAHWTGQIEANIVALAVAVARHVVGRELATDPSFVRGLVRQALAEFPLEQPLRVRVHPQDVPLLEAAAPEDEDPLLAGGREARWVPDPTIARGGCIVEGRERIIDGRVDTALERIYRRLTSTES
jgi:flagellar biosynthesis/type III secretory pathway protein FliH